MVVVFAFLSFFESFLVFFIVLCRLACFKRVDVLLLSGFMLCLRLTEIWWDFLFFVEPVP